MSQITISSCSQVMICPGIHDPQFTQNFLDALQSSDSSNLSGHWTQKALIFPIQDYPAYSAVHILQFLQNYISQTTPVIFISFSAGVAGAIGAAWGWEMMGGTVKAFLALDGWGVPLYGNFPIHRISHDYFTHWSSALLGTGNESFYAEPEIEHLDLWKKPESCSGWRVHPATNHQPEQRTYTTAAQFINQLLQFYSQLD